MSIVGGLDIHRKQLTFDWVDEQNDKWERGRIAPADREHLADWLTRFDPTTAGPVAFAMEGCTGWRYIDPASPRTSIVRDGMGFGDGGIFDQIYQGAGR